MHSTGATQGTMQPQTPTSQEKITLKQANSVYKSTIYRRGDMMDARLLQLASKKHVALSNREGKVPRVATPQQTQCQEILSADKCHTQKSHESNKEGVRSTKTKTAPFEKANKTKLRGKKKKDVCIKVYDVWETIFSDQTSRFPKQSMRGYKHVMDMVEIKSNAILVEPIKSHHDDKMKRAYKHLLLQLKRADITPKKYVLDNKVSNSIKNMIQDNYNIKLELVPPGCHRRNVA